MAWPRGSARWCGICGRRLDGGRPPVRRPRHGRIPARLVATVAALGVLTAVLAGTGGVVEVRSDVVEGPDPEAVRPAGAPDSPAPVEADAAPDHCRPGGCERWRVTGLEPDRPVLVHRDLAVHVGPEAITALDVGTGAVHWRQPHRDPRDGRVVDDLSAGHLDRRRLALAYGGHLRVHDRASGLLRHAIDLGPVEVDQLEQLGERLLAVGHLPGSGAGDATVLTVVDGDGDVRWQRTVSDLHQGTWRWHNGDPLLVTLGDDLARLSTDDGRVIWRRGVAGAAVHVDRPLLLTDPTTGTIEAVDALNGGTARRLEVDGARSAWFAGPWVAARTDTGIRVVDGDGRDHATFGDEVRHVEGRRLGDRFVLIASRVDGDTVVLVHGPHGDVLGTSVIEGSGDLDACCLHLRQRGDPHLGIVLGDRRTVVEVDLDDARPTRRHRIAVLDGETVRWHDDVALVRGEAGLRLSGPTGRVRVDVPGEVVSDDPLLVLLDPGTTGPGGLLRVEERLLGTARTRAPRVVQVPRPGPQRPR